MRATSCSVWISEAVVMASVKARVTFFSSFRGVIFFFFFVRLSVVGLFLNSACSLMGI